MFYQSAVTTATSCTSPAATATVASPAAPKNAALHTRLTEKTKQLALMCKRQICPSQPHQQLAAVITAPMAPTTTVDRFRKRRVHSNGDYDDDGHDASNGDGFTVVTSPLSCFGTQPRRGSGGEAVVDASKSKKGAGRGAVRPAAKSTTTTKWYVKQPTWRMWGEERERDAIFTVYLKKVRYHRPTATPANASILPPHDSDDDISHLEWETIRVRFVKAATLRRLVEALSTDDGELDTTFVNVFLATYRTFARPDEVLDLLLDRYERLYVEPPSPTDSAAPPTAVHTESISDQHKDSLIKALHVWLDGYPEDWHQQNLKKIVAFTSHRLSSSEIHYKALHRLDQVVRERAAAQQLNGWHHPHQLADAVGCDDDDDDGDHHHHHHHDGRLHPDLSNGHATDYTDYANYTTLMYDGIMRQHAPNGKYPRSPTDHHYLAHHHHHFMDTYRFPNVSAAHFAGQLTRHDVALFKRLIPHQCLGATWARRSTDKKDVHTVLATIEQFNAVLFAVISSVLLELNARPAERAAKIAMWIDIAKELRVLKNFSSLKAIVSGLQSNPIYRLRRTWEALEREKLEVYEELAAIFSQDNNEETHRDVLMREGTAKFAVTARETDRHLNKVLQKQNMSTSHGTIPYLGIFLFDLTMIHTAIPDRLPAPPDSSSPAAAGADGGGGGGYINFDKKRKEFEVLAQIKLLQGAANAYRLSEDVMFDRWFAGFPVLTELQAHDRSCVLEPPEPKDLSTSTTSAATGAAALAGSTSAKSKLFGHRKSASIASNSSSGAGSHDLANGAGSDLKASTSSVVLVTSRNNSLDRQSVPPNESIMSTTSSMSSLSMESSASCSNGRPATAAAQLPPLPGNGLSTIAPSIVNGQLHQTAAQKGAEPKFLIIRVSVKTAQTPADGLLQYKSIMLHNSDRTSQVIRNAMVKLDLGGDTDEWQLVYCLPDNEMVIQPNTNVFYAVDKKVSLNFMLRSKAAGRWENLI